MKKKAVEIKAGDKISLSGQNCLVENIEISEIGKQGKRKVRLVLLTDKKKKVVIIRPEDYPFDTFQ